MRGRRENNNLPAVELTLQLNHTDNYDYATVELRQARHTKRSLQSIRTAKHESDKRDIVDSVIAAYCKANNFTGNNKIVQRLGKSEEVCAARRERRETQTLA